MTFAVSVSSPAMLSAQLDAGVTGTDSPYLLDSWTTANGLPQNSVNDIVQTRDGYIWLATFGGLVRFDGVRFTVFSQAFL